MQKARVGLIGLGFGAEFIPIYQAHPKAEVAAICQRSKSKLDEVGDRFGIATRYTDFREVLTDPNVDFVHINSPIPDHAPQTVAALKAGKHVICTVPMATTLDEAKEIVGLVRETGLKYMMAETVVYSREYLFIKELYDKGELGKIQYMQASHPQDMEGWPDYWKDMVPMHYATHVVSPLMAMVNGMAELVSCFGSGTINEECARRSGSKFAVESCHIKIKDFGCRCPRLALPLGHRKTVSREHRRLRFEEVVRVAAHHRRESGAPYGQEAGVGDSRARRGSGLRASSARGNSQVHAKHR